MYKSFDVMHDVTDIDAAIGVYICDSKHIESNFTIKYIDDWLKAIIIQLAIR